MYFDVGASECLDAKYYFEIVAEFDCFGSGGTWGLKSHSNHIIQFFSLKYYFHN